MERNFLRKLFGTDEGAPPKTLRLIENGRGRSDTPSVSVIVVNEGGDKFGLDTTLDALLQQTFADFEVIVVADKRLGNTAETERRDRRISVLVADRSDDFCRNANLAAQIALGRYLLFISNRTRLQKSSLGKLVEAINSSRETGIAGPLNLHGDGSLNNIGLLIDKLGRPAANRRLFSADTELIDSIFFVSSSAMIIEKRLFRALKGFDEHCFGSLAGADLCWRAKLIGKKVVVNPWAIAYSEPLELSGKAVYAEQRFALRMLIKNYSARRALIASIQFTGSSVRQSFRRLAERDGTSFAQCWLALVWNFLILPDSIRQRRRIQRRRRRHDQAVLENVVPLGQPGEQVSSTAGER